MGTTFAKSKKGVVVLVALCMLFFYTGRLSSSTSGGDSSAFISLFPHRLVRTAVVAHKLAAPPKLWMHRAIRVIRLLKPVSNASRAFGISRSDTTMSVLPWCGSNCVQEEQDSVGTTVLP